MKLLPYSQLPLFYEITEVIRKNQIQSWQANDFWKRIQLESELEKTNANYQSVYRLVHRLLRDDYLTIDTKKNEMGCSTYSETTKMSEFRKEFCQLDNEVFQKIDNHCHILKETIHSLENEISAINDLKNELPEFLFELNYLYTAKTAEYAKAQSKLNVLIQLINSML